MPTAPSITRFTVAPSQTSTASSYDISRPASITEGEKIYIAAVVSAVGSSITCTDEDMVRIVNLDGGGGGSGRPTMAVFEKVATSSEPGTYTLQSTQSTKWAVACFIPTGGDNESELNYDTSVGSSTSTHPFTQIRPRGDAALVVHMLGARNSAVENWTDPSGVTRLLKANSNGAASAHLGIWIEKIGSNRNSLSNSAIFSSPSSYTSFSMTVEQPLLEEAFFVSGLGGQVLDGRKDAQGTSVLGEEGDLEFVAETDRSGTVQVVSLGGEAGDIHFNGFSVLSGTVVVSGGGELEFTGESETEPTYVPGLYWYNHHGIHLIQAYEDMGGGGGHGDH